MTTYTSAFLPATAGTGTPDQEVPAAGEALRPRPAHRADVARRSFLWPHKRLSVVLGAALLLTGCTVPGLPGASGAPEPMARAASVEEPAVDVTADPSAAPEATSEAGAPDAGASDTSGTAADDVPAVADAWVPVAADLDKGSATHTLTAAARNIVIDYWTDDDVSQLTPDSTPIIRINARVDGADDGTQISVTRFNAKVQSLGVDLANDTGSFAIHPPFTYTTAVALPANPAAHSTDVLVTFDLLSETAPGSGIFTRQTILDTVSLGYAQAPKTTR